MMLRLDPAGVCRRLGAVNAEGLTVAAIPAASISLCIII
jgi:hypothetical protein